MEQYDLVVVGGGPGGYTAAAEAAKLGLKTALVESGKLGGTCLHRGCIPTKAMLHVAEIMRTARQAEAFGVHAENVRLDYGEMLTYRQETVNKLADGVAAMLRTAGVTVLAGKGKVLPEGRVRVGTDEGETILEAKHVLLATGSRPKKLPLPGMDLPAVLDSDGLFALETLPESLVILGGGVIGVEMAEALSAMGTRVTILEAQPRLLPEMDKEISQNLRMIFKKRGIVLHVGAMLQSAAQNGEALKCTFTENNKEMTVEAQYVLCAVGRRPNSKGLFAAPMQSAMTPAGHIQVDEHFQTSVPGVYAIGDLIPGPQLAHAASAEGKAVAQLFAGRESGPNLSVIPRCVYTSPEIAEVGLTEKDAVERGIPVRVGKALMGANGRTQIAKGERGFIKIMAHAETGVILGASLMCERATDIVGELILAISNQLTVRDFLRAVRPHPTFEEALGEAGEGILSSLEQSQ